MIDWLVQAESFGGCNCDHWCPCQFEGLPTHHKCEGFEVFRISKGHFGDVDLSGVLAALFYAWPGPVFEGKGRTQVIIDVGANEAQAEALSRVLRGEETREFATHWAVFHAMSETVHEDLRLPILFDVNLQARSAKVTIPGVLEAIGEPIRSPVTGAPHRVQIGCPEGIEFTVADIGNARCKARGAIKLNLENTYGQFNLLHHTGNGPAHVR